MAGMAEGSKDLIRLHHFAGKKKSLKLFLEAGQQRDQVIEPKDADDEA